MGLIIFVGPKTHGYFAEEVAKTRDFDFKYIMQKGKIQDQTNDILFESKGKCDYIIFDVDQYINDADVIADEILAISSTINAKPIIYMPAFVPGSKMSCELIDRDIKAFIVSGTSKELKDQLEKNMTGFFDANERKEIEEIIKLQEAEQKQMEHFKTIGVAGACHRIGTTTQAIQIVKYLNLKGYSACLIEMNTNKYVDNDHQHGKNREISFVEKIKSWFDTDEIDEELGKVSCFGMDMFYKQNRITDVLKMGYDYYVYDYGVYSDRDFNKTSFVREDVKIFVVGSYPTELDYTKEIAENIFYEDAFLVFSLTAEDEYEDLLVLMDKIRINGSEKSNASRTYFAEYTPDPFSFRNIELYEDILPMENVNIEGEKRSSRKSKIGIFKRKKR